MGWVAIPETFQDDARMIEIGDAGFASLVRLWCYCGRHQNDGRLSWKAARALCDQQSLDALLREGLLARDADAIVVVDFLRFNVSRTQREDSRRVAADRKARWLERQKQRNAVPNAVPNAVLNAVQNAATGQDRTGQDSRRTQRTIHDASDDASSGVEAEKKQKKTRSKTSAPPHPNHGLFLREFCDARKLAGGPPYEVTGFDHGVIRRACADNVSIDRWRAACAAYARRSPDWLFRSGECPDLASFYRNLNGFISSSLAVDADARGVVNGRATPDIFSEALRGTNGKHRDDRAAVDVERVDVQDADSH